MKKLYSLLFAFLLGSLFVNAQGIYQMWGMTQAGGPDNYGAMFSANATGNNFQGRHGFLKNPFAGASPQYTTPVLYNGKFYGMTLYGGDYGLGVIFEWDPATNIYTRKYNFINGTSGSNPYGSLTLSGDKFYGMTTKGGANNEGVIFEWNPTTNIYISKISFNGTNGSTPYGSLTSNDGKLYGMTNTGGTQGDGVIFEYDPITNIYNKKFDFDSTNTNGASPKGDLTLSGGKFYGMTYKGGSGKGVIFEWDPATNGFIKKYDFNNANGAYPYASLTFNSGKFYGTTNQGGAFGRGVIFEWDPATNIFIKKYDFDYIDGNYPTANMTLWGGRLFGMANKGGATGAGVIFEWNPATNLYTKKFDFNGPNGSNPSGSMALYNGRMYGLTSGGGKVNQGTIFQYDPAENSFAKKIDFNPNLGIRPYGALALSGGKFYGMANNGGANSAGVIFEYDPATGVYSAKYDFDYANGRSPYGSLTLSNGKFYGMTYYGGLNNVGVIFEYNPVTNIYTKKYDFNNTSGNGYYPYGSLTLSGGKLYGMTCNGGNFTGGTIFEYDPATNIFTKKQDLGFSTGSFPYGSMALYGGRLYGMTNNGGSNGNGYGVIFEYNPATNVYISKFEFSGINGKKPFGDLTLNGSKFYGMTNQGGGANFGVIFEWDPATNIYTNKIDFNAVKGGNPYGSLTLSGGKLYGMNGTLGTNNFGTMFEYDPATNIFTKKQDFTGLNGQEPSYGNNLSFLPAPVAKGALNTCTSFASITINNTNNNIWVSITDTLGDAIGEIKANGNNLGVVSTSMYINNGPVREDGNNRLYLDRNISITPQVQPSTPVDIRLYLKGSEFEALKNATNSLGQPSGINTINDVSFFKNSGACSPIVQNSANPVTVTAAAWNNDYVLAASISAFSSFYLANKTYAVLPLKLSEFNARFFQTDGELSWKTENEINTLSFDIERSTDGISFIAIGNEIAANTSGVHLYNYTDKNISAIGVPLLYYRLKQKDNNGRFTYSRIITLFINAGKETVTIYPNPVTNESHFIIRINQAEKIEGRITDNSGRVIKKQQWNIQAGSSSLSLDIAGLAKGIYTLELEGERTHEKKQFVKQ
jgi:uncharacterized repeat protein (TIGR03803 family)